MTQSRLTAKERESRIRLADTLEFQGDAEQIEKYKLYAQNIALTDDGAWALSQFDKKIPVILQGVEDSATTGFAIRINVNGDGYSVGSSGYVELSGMRVLAHEIGHAAGLRNGVDVDNENYAMKFENVVMKQHSLMTGGRSATSVGERLEHSAKSNRPAGPIYR